MPRSHLLRWLLSIAGLLGLLVCLTCVRSGSPGLETAYPVAPADESQPDSSTTLPAPVDSAAKDDAPDAQSGLARPDAQPVAAAVAQPDGGSPVGRMMRATDPQDRKLLSDIERETGHTPSQAIVELVQRRHAGATQAELKQLIETQLTGDLRERMAAQRWLRAVFPGDTQGDASSPRPGAGGGTRRLTPIEPKPR